MQYSRRPRVWRSEFAIYRDIKQMVLFSWIAYSL